MGTSHSGRWDWAALKARIVKHGLRNSLLVAPMPTASTAQILGNSESFEPYTQNLYVRRVLSGEFVQVNRLSLSFSLLLSLALSFSLSLSLSLSLPFSFSLSFSL